MTGLNGRHCRAYKAPGLIPDGYLFVTYHRNIKGKLRQLTLGKKLMRKVLRDAR